MIGMFKPKDREIWKSILVSSDPNTTFQHYLKQKDSLIHSMNINDTTYYQVYNKMNIVKEESESPIYNQILDLSHIELHKLIQIIKSEKGIVLDLSTDCVFPKDFPCQIENDSSNVIEYYYDK